jgi:RHS repeat-associated protein
MIKRCGLVDRIFFNPVQRTQYYPSGLPWAEGLNPGLQQRKYNGKEFLEMSGYDTYDYGARGYYPAMGRFMTIDPLAEKYYSISPYAYCLNNPVKFVDPDGMRVETGSMTKDEQKEYDKMIALLSKSDLFKTLYSTLVKSDNLYAISFGQTDKDKSGNSVPGDFKPDNKTNGGSITFLKGSNLNSAATTEELAHAYQNENKTLENPNVNPEFEAKTITQLIGEDVAGYGSYNGMTNFQSYLESEYHNVLTPKDVSSSKFQSNYQNAAILYSAYNQTNNIGNPHYRQLTLQQPATLMRLVNNTFLKNMPWVK